MPQSVCTTLNQALRLKYKQPHPTGTACNNTNRHSACFFVAGAIKEDMMTAAVVIFAECRKCRRVPQNTKCDAHIAACAAVTRAPLHILARDVHSWWMDAGTSANVSTGAAMLHARFMLLGGRSIHKLSVTAVQPCLSDAVNRPLQEGSMMPQPGKHTTQTTCSCNFCRWSA